MKTITHFKSIESFSTQRLAAEKITSADLEKLTKMHTNPDVMATLGGLRTAKQIQENLEWNLKQWADNGFGLWLFYLNQTKEWIGRGGLRRVEVDGNEEIELNYALMPSYWNEGYATEIAQSCIEIAFDVLRMDNIVCFTLASNKASQKVMEKAGFQYEREIIHADAPHVLYRMKNPRKIEVVPYSTAWPEFFSQEEKRLQDALGDHLLSQIYHIGSTAIPNMPAKPIIDIMLECKNLDDINLISEKLNTLNYYNIRRHVIPHRSFFTRRQDEKIGFNLHIREAGDPQIKRHVNFRDYVTQHSDDARAYAQLKMALAEKFTNDMNSYVFGKDKLVQQIDTKAKQWPERKNDYAEATTGHIASQWSNEKLVKAMEANLNVHMTHFAQYLNQVELIRIPGFTIVNSGLPDDTFNYVIEADFSSAEASKKISEITHYFTQKNTPFSWWVSPYDKPDNLPEHLEKNNYVNTENNIAMYFDLDAWDGDTLAIPELHIVQANDEKTLRDFALVLTNDEEAFKEYFSWIASVMTDDDPIEYYVGYVNNKPVVRGLTCYFAQVAGLHWLSTAHDERKKGYGAAMQQYRLKRAKERGYHIAVLQASGEGYPLYRRLGYKECGVFKEFKLTK